MVPVTLLYGAVNALVTLLLGLNTSRVRDKAKQYVGDAPGVPVIRASRAHGNNAEWVPLAIVLLLLLELTHVSSLWLHVLGGSLFAGRLLHAHGILAKKFTSTVGATITYLVVGAEIVVALYFRFLVR